MDLELHIEALVLEGVAPHAGEHVRSALESELTLLLTERGAPPALAQGGTAPYLDGGTVEVRPEHGPEWIGVQIAQAVYEGLWQ
jgi:hypothetical protein